MNTIAARFTYLRESQKLSQADFAKKIGVTAATISRIENGIQNPSAETLITLSQNFGVSSDWILLGNNGYAPPDIIEKELEPFLKKIDMAYKKGNQNIKGWVLVQLERAFPEIAEELKKEHEEAAAADVG